MKATNVWTAKCPVPLDRLSLVTSINYVDFAGKDRNDGELMVLDVVAPSVVSLFQSLYERRFAIHQIRCAHHFQGDDLQSMSENNTSAFCDRPIEGTAMPSLHSYGLAIDINPVQNPIVVFPPGHEHMPAIQPESGWEYLNRANRKPGMVEDLVLVMAQHGFTRWGGSWTTPIDYHHFEVPRHIAEQLVSAGLEVGTEILKAHIKSTLNP